MAYQQARIELSLFDLDNDVSETTDVKDKFPEVIEQLQIAAEKAREDLGDTLTKRQGNGLRAPGKRHSNEERLKLNW